MWLTADKNHAPPCAQTLGLILIKTPTPSLTQNGTSVWSKFWPKVWSQTGSRFGQISAPKFDQTRDLILMKILTQSLILNGTSFWSKVWLQVWSKTGSHFDPNSDPQFDTKWAWSVGRSIWWSTGPFCLSCLANTRETKEDPNRRTKG